MATPVPNAKVQLFDASGNPVSGGRLFTYIAGTTTPLASYTDATEATTNANPVILDSAGMANVWLGQSAYKLVLQNSAGAQLWSVDNVYGGTLLSGYITAIERAAPSGVAGSDIFYPDSAAHRWKMINNNGAAKTVAALESDTFTTPTITSPTTTGTDAGAETLQNKTLNGASSGNAVTLLNAQNNLSPITGTGADANLFTYTLPANVLATGKALRITVGFNHSTGTAAATYKFKVGSTTFSSSGASAATGQWFYTVTIYNQGSALASKLDYYIQGTAIAVTAAYTAGLSADFTASQALAMTFSVAATDQVTPNLWMVELIQ
jgi:hypothetical protein